MSNSEDSLFELLDTAVIEKNWQRVGSLLGELKDSRLRGGIVSEKLVCVIEQACETFASSFCGSVLHILPHVDGDLLSKCSTDQLDSLLTTATSRRFWHMVKKVLKAGGSLEKRLWVVKQACETCDYKDFERNILPNVDGDFLSQLSTKQLDTLLTTATTKRLWHMVNTLLKAGCSHGKRAWAIEQACKRARFKNFNHNIMPYVRADFLSQCTTYQLKTLLTTAIKRGLRQVLHKMLEIADTHSKRVWIIEQAAKTAGYKNFESYILPYIDNDFLLQCSTEQLDTLLTTATTQGLWNMLTTVLKAGGSLEKRALVITQACKTASNCNFKSYILPHVDGDFLSQCSTEHLDTLLTTLTQWKLWHMVDKVFETAETHAKRVWVIEQVSKTVGFDDFESYILPYVDDDFLSHSSIEQLDILLTTATTQGLWHMVNKLLKVFGSHGKRFWVIEQACTMADRDSFERDILPFVDNDFLSECTQKQMDMLLTAVTTNKWWNIVDTFLDAGCTCSHTMRALIIERACQAAGSLEFESYILPHVNHDFLSHCSTNQLESLLKTATTLGWQHMAYRILQIGVCSQDQIEFSLQHFVTRAQWECVVEVLKRDISEKSKIMALSEACKGRTYTTVMEWINLHLRDLGAKILINSLPSNQLSSEAQSVALMFALQQRRWDIISRACLSQVWEQVRRHLFREAVNQRQWTVVKKRADHTLYDDERWWALEEAYKQKQWDVMLQLADHGLTEIELMRVRYRLAKHADWDVVLRMIGRGVDVTELREVVESAAVSRKTAADEAKRHALALRWKELRQLEENLTHMEEKLTRAISDRRFKLSSIATHWNTVLFHLHRHPGTFTRTSSHHQPRKTVGELLLQRAIRQRRWHIVMHLVTLGMDTEKLNSLLTDMIRRRQWGVCRVLLKQGVSVQSCLHALPVFTEKYQWTLVAMVIELMEDDAFKCHLKQVSFGGGVGSLVWQCGSAMCRYSMCVGDEVRLHVMHRAMERREGSVVGQCISTMQHYRLSVKEREIQFQQAISRGVLQAVKPLVEEKEETEFQHRDETLLAAIEQRQWDVVDCCQLQGADIDMKDKRGETPLNREARNGDWKAVEELAVRGANPNIVDKDGCSVLNMAIHANQWEIVRLLIECLGNIHKSARYEPDYEKDYEPDYEPDYELDYESLYDSDSDPDNEASPLLSKGEVPTPLQLLIDKRQGEIIEHTLIWSPDQPKGVNNEGETTLHAVVLDKKPELLYYQIVRGVNPLKLSKGGHSVLLYAVGNEHCPQRMVAECIRLGFSTHQPQLTLQTTVDVAKSVANCLLYGYYHSITSPFLLAVLRGMSVVAHMLYESGSCSYTELLQLYTTLFALSDPHTEEGKKLVKGPTLSAHLRQRDLDEYQHRYEIFISNVTSFLPDLREMASTPRSLVSTCRLVISHCLTVHRRRERAVQDLDLTDRMKNYFLFSDLTDPDYQRYVYGTLPPRTSKD